MRDNDESQSRRLIELVVEIQLEGTDQARNAELQDLLAGSESLRRLYLELMNLQGLLADSSLGVSLSGETDDSAEMEALLEAMAQVEAAAGEVEPIRLPTRPADTGQRKAHGPPIQTPPPSPRVIVIPRPVFWGGLAAAVLLVGLLGWNLLDRQPNATSPMTADNTAEPAADPATPTEQTAPRPVATLTATRADQWLAVAGSQTPKAGDPLVPGQRLTLTLGYAQITTAQGAVAILEAPCTVELTESPNAIRLISGKLVGLVSTEQAKGFVVTTPQMEVIDVGTRFGVSSTAAGTSLRVMEGRVLAAAVAGEGPYLQLLAGQSAVTATDARRVSLVNIPTDRFVMDWHAIRNQPELIGDIRYEPSMPGDLRIGGYESNQILLFSEQSGVVLTSPVTVNITQPGLHRDDALQTPTQLAPATVDSYLIHLDTPAGPSAGGARTAIIRFNRPILAVISNSQAMSQSHRTLGQPDVLYGSLSPGKLGEYSGLDRFDLQPETVELSEDRKTLTLRLSALEGIDQARILVASDITP